MTLYVLWLVEDGHGSGKFGAGTWLCVSDQERGMASCCDSPAVTSLALQPRCTDAIIFHWDMKLLEQTLSEAEQVGLVRRIVDSQLFRRSQRLRGMLTFIGEQTISQGRSSVREQEIGVAIFGRKVDYDTAVDNIVRVNASELRRRLERYFETEGTVEDYIVELPRGGGYGLHYYRRPVGPSSSSLVEPQRKVSGQVGLQPISAEVKPHDLKALPPEPMVRASWFALALLVCGLALVGCLLLSWRVHSLVTKLDPWGARPQLKGFWGDVFAPGKETDIVVGDSTLMLEQELLGRKVSLDQYLSNSYRFQGGGIGDPNVRRFVDLLHSHNIGGVADFEVVKRILAVSPPNAPVRFGSARDYVPEEVRNHNLILVGSRVPNPWVDLFKDRLAFSIDRDEAAKVTIIHNRHPRPGEQAEYRTNLDAGQATVYSVIAFLPNLDKSSTALLIGGTDSQGTKAAGDFLTSEQGLKQIADRLHGFPHFELLLRSSRVAGTTLHTEIVAIRNEH